MRVSYLFDGIEYQKIIDLESITTLLLSYYNNVRDNLQKVNNFKIRPELQYVNDYINDDYQHKTIINKKNVEVKIHKDVNLNKHRVLTHFFSSKRKPFIEILNYKFPNDLKVEFNGPYLSGSYILFYHKSKNVLIAFNYVPLKYMKYDEYKTRDYIIRDLNSYIIDNVSIDHFKEYILNQVVYSIDFNKIIEPLTLTLRYEPHGQSHTNNKFYILKLLKETIEESSDKHPFYKWCLVQKHIN